MKQLSSLLKTVEKKTFESYKKSDKKIQNFSILNFKW